MIDPSPISTVPIGSHVTLPDGRSGWVQDWPTRPPAWKGSVRIGKPIYSERIHIVPGHVMCVIDTAALDWWEQELEVLRDG